MRWQTGLAIPLNVLTQAGKLAEMTLSSLFTIGRQFAAIRILL